MMAGEEYESFKADIAANGCHNPVWTFEGKILDGRNRYRACTELGIEPVFAEYDGSDPAGFVESQNKHRRHLTAEWRKEQVKKKRAEGKSTRQIAAEVGAAQSTVVEDIRAGERNRSPEPERAEPEAEPEPNPESAPVAPTKVKGRDGKTYAATKKAQAPVKKAEPKAEPAPWAEVVSQLERFCALVEQASSIPEDMKPWDLVKALEETGHALLGRALHLRKRHHL